ncbi:kinase-like domain-containing protein [Scenedesmus sp. NREL 46B-D3]|nr:kinase-like domain-containing protein [Scenedesmus sp. NREL 46B-D3]
MVVTVIIIKFDRGLGASCGKRHLVRAAAEDEQKQAHFAAAEAGRLDLPFESDASDMQTFSGGSTPGRAAAGSNVQCRQAPVIKGRYAVQEALGRGANAVTYRAIDNTNGHEGLAHPGIPAYIDYFEEDTANDRAFYIEVVQGKSLAQMVSSGMRADESQVMRIAQELLATLKYLAGLRPPVIHRDIKPENVVLEAASGWQGVSD